MENNTKNRLKNLFRDIRGGLITLAFLASVIGGAIEYRNYGRKYEERFGALNREHQENKRALDSTYNAQSSSLGNWYKAKKDSLDKIYLAKKDSLENLAN